LGTETDQPNGLETQECSVAETPRLRRTPAKRRLLAQSQENLCGAGVIGGAMRTRTKNPDGFIDGARRDRRAIVARPCGNGGLSTPTPPISSAAAPGKTTTSRASNRVFATNSSTARHSTRYAKRKPSSRVGGVTTTYQAARARGVRARARRVAGCATSNGSAGHAGAQANLKLTFPLDQSVGAV
jgi:hypothetical protein